MKVGILTHARSRPRSIVIVVMLCTIAARAQAADTNEIQIGETVLTCTTHAVGSDIAARMFHRAELLADGRVLVTGGIGVNPLPPALFSIDALSVYDASRRTFSVLNGPNGQPLKLLQGRAHHTQTQLNDGRILITGGRTGAWERYDGRDSDTVELINIGSGLVSAGSPMNEKRIYHSATKLADGRVLVAGGQTWQVFDPISDSWSAPIKLKRRRWRHVALLVDASHVLLVGGLGSGGNTLEMIDIDAGTSSLFKSRFREHINDHGAALLPDGRVLIIGGQKNFQLETLNDCYLFDIERDDILRIDGPATTPGGISDFQLIQTNEHVVILGGEAEKGRHDTELDLVATFSYEHLEWSSCAKLSRPRDDAAAVKLPDGSILIVGGAASAFKKPIPTASAEVIRTKSKLLGDINQDGHVDDADVKALNALIDAPGRSTDALDTLADVTRDGKVDGRDQRMLANAVKAKQANAGINEQ